MSVKVSDTAIREIAAIVQQQGLDPEKVCLRVGVKGGGCSGFSYLLDLTENRKDTDEVWAFTADLPAPVAVGGDAEEGGTATAGGSFTLHVICDPKSYLYLNGTEVDFKEDIMQRGFVFNNPNATSSCGCGSSFSA